MHIFVRLLLEQAQYEILCRKAALGHPSSCAWSPQDTGRAVRMSYMPVAGAKLAVTWSAPLEADSVTIGN